MLQLAGYVYQRIRGGAPDDWAELAPASGRLDRFVTPRTLAPDK